MFLKIMFFLVKVQVTLKVMVENSELDELMLKNFDFKALILNLVLRYFYDKIMLTGMALEKVS